MTTEEQPPTPTPTSVEITPVPPAGEPGLEKAIAETVQAAEREIVSEKVIVAAPLSFAGSGARIWKLTKISDETAYKIATTVTAVMLIAFAWTFILAWYLLWGVFLVPYRLIRRGQRKRKREALMHRETLTAIERSRNQ